MNNTLMPVRLEDTWIVLDASAIRELLAVQTWLVVPQASLQIPGVCAWRGRAVPVVDLARILGLGTTTNTQDYGRTLVAEHPHGLAAIPVKEAQVVQFVHGQQERDLAAASLPYATRGVELEGMLLPYVDIVSVLEALLPQEPSLLRA